MQNHDGLTQYISVGRLTSSLVFSCSFKPTPLYLSDRRRKRNITKSNIQVHGLANDRRLRATKLIHVSVKVRRR